jgi:hypothetical protein
MSQQKSLVAQKALHQLRSGKSCAGVLTSEDLERLVCNSGHGLRSSLDAFSVSECGEVSPEIEISLPFKKVDYWMIDMGARKSRGKTISKRSGLTRSSHH